MRIDDFEILRDIDRRIAELQNTHDRGIGNLKSELRLLHQETIHYRTGILERLDKLEKKALKPMIDWQAVINNLWFKIAILLALATGNTQLIEIVSASFKG